MNLNYSEEQISHHGVGRMTPAPRRAASTANRHGASFTQPLTEILALQSTTCEAADAKLLEMLMQIKGIFHSEVEDVSSEVVFKQQTNSPVSLANPTT